MNGVELQCLNQDADRLSVQSSVATTWAPVRRKFRFLGPKRYDVSMTRDEVLVLKSRGAAEIRLKHLGGPYGALICNSSRKATRVLRPTGPAEVFHLDDGEALILRTEQARDPRMGHSVAAGAI